MVDESGHVGIGRDHVDSLSELTVSTTCCSIALRWRSATAWSSTPSGSAARGTASRRAARTRAELLRHAIFGFCAKILVANLELADTTASCSLALWAVVKYTAPGQQRRWAPRRCLRPAAPAPKRPRTRSTSRCVRRPFPSRHRISSSLKKVKKCKRPCPVLGGEALPTSGPQEGARSALSRVSGYLLGPVGRPRARGANQGSRGRRRGPPVRAGCSGTWGGGARLKVSSNAA